ncbi:transforming growth factor beta receptor type 3 [Lingula anatina]|uniref:Transforming growth factor beta receptor type 3 n=1 Tax=Lingula anatina TaxID=7574 RepID=A0A1S3K3U5_LINAN|nr:transforming growth factor beta receptor type 3 [Lingula anatina]XP_013417197.1 transforming growth factor beta receptor type 3 [Lingula anatina]|eukprot:XP_013417196.1 transforming growth factor beta receptor type 3 [Lingula anatina]
MKKIHIHEAVVLYIGALAAIAPEVASKCAITYPYSSPYVSPVYEQLTPSGGCVSSNITPSRKEVHVINLQGTLLGGDHPVITLHILPLEFTGPHSGPLVFVLSSAKPVTWHLQTGNIANRSSIFWLSPGSRISGDTYIVKKQNERRQNMPADSKTLLQWSERKFHAVTSLMEVMNGNNVFKQVGIAPESPSSCIFQKPFESSSSVAAYIQPQPMSGCAETSREGMSKQDMHIIELHSSAPVAREGASVTINIVTEKERSISRDLLLILKAHQDISWHIKTKNLVGRLEIVANRSISRNGVKMHTTIQYDELNRSREELISWSERQYGPIVSYTEVQIANRMNLLVKDVQILNTTPTTPTTSTTTTSSTTTSRSRMATSSRSRSRGPTGHGLKSPFINRDLTKTALQHALKVACNEQDLEATLDKLVLQPCGVRAEQLSLVDDKCRPEENATHFIFKTGYHQCRTVLKRNKDTGLRSYVNSVIIHRRQRDDEIINWRNGRQVPDDHNEGSGFSSLDGTYYSDDEDLTIYDLVIHKEFRCMPRYFVDKNTSTNVIRGDSLPELGFKLSFYKDDQFIQPEVSSPLQVEQGGTIFVGVDVIGDAIIQPMLLGCWLSDTAYGERDKVMLFDRGCKMDDTLKWLTKGTGKNILESLWIRQQRFSFEFARLSRKNIAFLNCEVDTCSRDGRSNRNPPVRKCMPPGKMCLTSRMTVGEGQEPAFQAPSEYSKVVYAGPIVQIERVRSSTTVIPTKPRIPSLPIPSDGPATRLHTDSSKGKQQPTHIVYGLESGTVVGIAFAAFVIGVLLTGALWYIHTHTGPVGQPQPAAAPKGTRSGKGSSKGSLESSMECTPNSFTPIAS